MNFVTVFFPLYEVRRSKTKQTQTAAIIREWEEKRARVDAAMTDNASTAHTFNTANTSNTGNTKTTSSSSRKSDLYSLRAFNKVLEQGPDALLHYATTKQFCGENVLFLNAVRLFKRDFAIALTESEAASDESRKDAVRRRYFEKAVYIYATMVDEAAEPEINIEGPLRKEMATLLAPAAKANGLLKKSAYSSHGVYLGAVSRVSNEHDDTQALRLATFKNPSTSVMSHGPSSNMSQESVLENGFGSDMTGTSGVPADFGLEVFDKAFASVHNMVFLNTWGRFVDSMTESASLSSEDSRKSWSFMSFGKGTRV